jgi:hypothetical protein
MTRRNQDLVEIQLGERDEVALVLAMAWKQATISCKPGAFRSSASVAWDRGAVLAG